MIKEAQAKGLSSEKTMWESINDIDEMLCMIKKEHPDIYWKFIRKLHKSLYNGHYTEDFAMYDVENIEYTDRNGRKQHGAYWSVNQVEDATKNMIFPAGVNKWDKYVAANLAYSDFCKKFDDEQILQIMYSFFFSDEDWPTVGTKAWDYVCCKLNKK